MKIVIETSGDDGSILLHQSIPYFVPNVPSKLPCEITYTNTIYLREHTRETLSPFLTWRALRHGWSILDELRRSDSKIISGQVSVDCEDRILSFGGEESSRRRVNIPLALIRWDGGDFLAHCCLTHRSRVNPYTIEFKESMLVKERRGSKWISSLH